jgi:hypothetical protein
VITDIVLRLWRIIATMCSGRFWKMVWCGLFHPSACKVVDSSLDSSLNSSTVSRFRWLGYKCTVCGRTWRYDYGW